MVQQEPAGLCDAIFRAAPFVAEPEHVLVGLPDTVWFPRQALCALPRDRLAFLLFPVADASAFDAVVTDACGRVEQVQVKQPQPRTNWVWGAFGMPGRVLHELHALWQRPDRGDEYFGTLANAWLERGGVAAGIRAGQAYADVGTLHGYRQALALLDQAPAPAAEVVLPFRGQQVARAGTPRRADAG